MNRILSAESSEKVYLNKEIEESWTDDDRELFCKLSFEERVFYADYLSTEFEITKFLVDFANTNGAVLSGLVSGSWHEVLTTTHSQKRQDTT